MNTPKYLNENLKNKNLCLKCGKCCREIFHCPHLTSDNLCSIYENRPERCKEFPVPFIDKVPDGCGFEGFMFVKQELLKKKIRVLKETIIDLKAELNFKHTPDEVNKIVIAINSAQNTIDSFAEYGSKDW